MTSLYDSIGLTYDTPLKLTPKSQVGYEIIYKYLTEAEFSILLVEQEIILLL
ncbi:hypothetical protein BpOF4_21019 (plasmid) [Alkalihalophilus pseudofirmus OF4]|uniref:Uncharacterized protein n=1 Tax=Alkalihalophilus pseudofirmus (strain ATCC BAA-2126 / JCM 17055 / OF4) TaxID=398511 RepID=D3G1H3_ALKPO|nr:hypothetical protein BpOF4_21019 [Alkalihalophilus pseudofirmus OF4]